jgi:hypothetical protein
MSDMIEQIAKAMWMVAVPSNPWETALDDDYYDGPGRDTVRKMASAAIEAIRPTIDNFRLLFVADGDPPALTLDVDPNDLANAYDELAKALPAPSREDSPHGRE